MYVLIIEIVRKSVLECYEFIGDIIYLNKGEMLLIIILEGLLDVLNYDFDIFILEWLCEELIYSWDSLVEIYK